LLDDLGDLVARMTWPDRVVKRSSAFQVVVTSLAGA
jgi:hypothetical protein